MKIVNFICCLFMISFFSVDAWPATKKVLVIYDQGEDKRLPACTDAKYLSNLLGHFNTSTKLMPVAEYKSGAMNNNDIVFYVNYEKKFTLPQDFKNDFFKFNKTFCWLNHQIEGLDPNLLKTKYGFHFKEYREDLGFSKVIYNGVMFPKGDDNVNIVEIDNAAVVKIKAVAVGRKGEKVPYIINSGNLWFVADSPFSYASERDRYLAFADILHDIIGEDHPKQHIALVRIEDINPLTEPDELLKTAKYLSANKVPFAVSLVPVYVDPGKKLEIHLEDKPELLSVLRKIPKLGGSFVMHGYTHQYHGVTTDDYEFWDDIADKPVRGDSVENTSVRIEKSLKEFFSNGIYPFVWETPHYFGSKNTYLAVKKYFSLVYERRKTMEYLGTDQYFPYPIKDIFGQKVIPENLGYLQIEKPDPKAIIEAAKLNLSIRDGYASFFYHTFVDLDNLKEVVKGIKALGYQFGDIRDFSPSVIAKDKAVLSTGNYSIKIDSQDKYISEEQFNFKGKTLKHVNEINSKSQFVKQVSCPESEYCILTTQDALEPGILKKIWRYAKTDLFYFDKDKENKNSGRLNKIMVYGLITPSKNNISLQDKNDLESFKYSLSVAGIKFMEVNAGEIKNVDLRDYDVLVVPNAVAKGLQEEQIAAIKEAVNSGSNILLDCTSKLSEELGIEIQEEEIPVKQVRDFQYPEIPLYWMKQYNIKPVYHSSENNYKILCVEEESNLPVVVSGQHGKGKFIFFASHFDPNTPKGYSQYPFLIEMLETVFDFSPISERRVVEMYFDPGMRQFISIEKLAKLWRKHGVNKIYAGGWHFYDKYTYDYERLIKVCHENGILVYCWLEPPMVSRKFWNKYPEWREKTALLKDAKVSWRYLMNFSNEKCRKKAFDELESLLMGLDWDGVNVAELYFESSGGPSYPENFTPMNSEVRNEFKHLQGFDPIEIFKKDSVNFWKVNPDAWKKFAAYRIDLCYRQKRDFLVLMEKIKENKKDFEVMLTAIDVTIESSLSENISEDTSRLISLQKKYGFALQVEDPSMLWNGKPERYSQLGEYYRKLVPDAGRLILDCNVLDNHKKGDGGLPAEKPTGEEIRQITHNMDLSGSRLAYYSEETLYENDYKNISTVLAREAEITEENETQWRIKTPYMVSVKTGKKDLVTKLDGELWFAGEGDIVIVPPGEHVLNFEAEPKYFDMAGLKPKLLYISSELKWANFMNSAVEFSYDSGEVPCYVIVNKRPSKIYIDSKRASCTVLGKDGNFSVKLPAGSRVVKITAGAGLSALIEKSGVVLISLIIIFGFFTSVMFLGLFITIQIKRKLK